MAFGNSLTATASPVTASAGASSSSVTPPPPQQDDLAKTAMEGREAPQDDLAKQDDQPSNGAAIETFSNYEPRALPLSVVSFCNQAGSSSTGSSVGESTGRSSSLLTVQSHTSMASESALLSSVSAPIVQREAAEALLPLLRINPKALSPLQLEGALLAIQRHRRIENVQQQTSTDDRVSSNRSNYGGYRAGFFLGDGAGIGKGRQISAVLRDSFSRGRVRHLWLSVSRQLIQDAKRDLSDVGVFCDIHDGTQLLSDRHAALGRSEKGVMFLTYQLLVSNSRVESIIAWCAGTEILKKSKSAVAKVEELEQSFEGCIVFDEAHKAKNLADDTKTAKLVLELQRRLPRARVIYSSATGVSHIAQLAYAERLGLWGTDNRTSTESEHASFSNFKTFQGSLEKRGLGSMELLALELKTRGSFIARTLSWDGAEFRTELVPLTFKQQRVYNDAVVWWNKCKESLEWAFKVLGTERSSLVWRTFWAAHQRFFKELAICAKIPYIAKDAASKIDEGCAIVIGLQSTGETALQTQLQSDPTGKSTNPTKKMKSIESQQFPELISTALTTMTGFVEKNFPTTPSPPTPPSIPNRQPATREELFVFQSIQAEIDRINRLSPPEPVPSLLKLKASLLKHAMTLQLPANPLDDLIDRLGGEGNVAEMTGRAGRIVRVGSCMYQYKKRVTEKAAVAAVSQDEAADRVNLVERRSFMDGEKSVAIISDAASTGISLHAAKGSLASYKRRVHYTIELPWSADRAVQQLGRSHRSGQDSAPIYKLVVTDLGGERRFAAAVSKRLASLGALTKGDRRAATGSDMSDFDLDSKYGNRALKRFYKSVHDSQVTPSDAAVDILPSRKSTHIMSEFAKSIHGQGFSDPSGKPNFSALLSLLLVELERVGIDEAARGKAIVKIFLNRIAGVPVAHQALIFSLFMSTFDDVIREAKSSGEFEGTAEDIKATSIEIGEETNLVMDQSCGVFTKLTTLFLDRGISLSQVCALALEVARKEMYVDSGKLHGKGKLHDKRETTANDNSNKDDEDIDIGDDDDIWFSQTKGYRAEDGFYISKKQIAGRNLVLFAKGKFDRSMFENENDAANFDPMGLMQVSRPNTGTNHTSDITSSELKRKYKLTCSCQDLYKAMNKDSGDVIANEAFVDLVKERSAKTTELWELAFEESNSFTQTLGLAPRRQKVTIVTGPVLHILPILEKAVQFKSERDRAMRIIRATVGERRIVGPRFPSDDETRDRLQTELGKVAAARSAGNTFMDEDYAPICSRSMKWATIQRPTMKTFFSAIASKTKEDASKNSDMAAKRSSTVCADPSTKKKMKTTSMKSFFAPKKK